MAGQQNPGRQPKIVLGRRTSPFSSPIVGIRSAASALRVTRSMPNVAPNDEIMGLAEAARLGRPRQACFCASEEPGIPARTGHIPTLTTGSHRPKSLRFFGNRGTMKLFLGSALMLLAASSSPFDSCGNSWQGKVEREQAKQAPPLKMCATDPPNGCRNHDLGRPSFMPNVTIGATMTKYRQIPRRSLR